MSIEDNVLWQAFVEEVGEQLEFLESELVNFKSADEKTINEVFRFFHSIKSSSAIFHFVAMEEVAHAAETLLDKIRQRTVVVNDDIVSLLLACADSLKSQLLESMQTLQPPAADISLLQALSAFAAHAVFGDAHPVKSAEESNALGIDPVQLDEFANLFTAGMVKFFTVIEQGSTISRAKLTAVEKTLAQLVAAAEILDMTLFARTLGKLTVWLQGSRDDNKQLFHLFQILMEQVNAVEKLADYRFALVDIYDAVDTLFGEDFSANLAKVENGILHCQHELLDTRQIDSAHLGELCDSVDKLAKHFSILNLCGSTDLFRYFSQACRKAMVSDYTVDAAVFSLIHSFVLAHGEAVSEPLRQQSVDQDCKAAFRQFRNLLDRRQDDGFHRYERIAELTTLLDLEPDFMDYVENTEIELLENCIREHKNIAVLVVDIESNPVWSAGFIQWLNQHELITSRTVYSQKTVAGKTVEHTKSSFLVAFDDTEDVIAAAIDRLGDGQSCVDELSFRFPTQSYKHTRATSAPVAVTAAAADLTDAAIQIERRTGDGDSGKTLRVNSDAIDSFVSQVGEMVLHRNMLSHVLADSRVAQMLKNCRNVLEKSRNGQLSQEQMDALGNALGSIGDSHNQLLQAHAKLNDSVSRVQKDVMTLRVVPISIVFNRLPRVVRNINVNYGKDIRLQIAGESVRVDKSMVDILMEPLVHLVRNCADHGVESPDARRKAGKPPHALIEVTAEQRGSYLEIRVSDDGNGLDYQRIHAKAVQLGYVDQRASVSESELKMMIFRAGFSTSETVTEISGRGVGMDAVRARIAAIGGSIDVDSVAGKGTTFTLKLPVSAAIQGVILFLHDGEALTIPERNVVLGLTIPVSQIQSVQGQAAFIHQNKIMPLYSLSELLGWGNRVDKINTHREKTEQEVIIISNDDCHIALAVDKVVDRQEIFVRELHNDLLKLPGVGGASILGNGEVVIILDADALLQIASKQSQCIESILKAS